MESSEQKKSFILRLQESNAVLYLLVIAFVLYILTHNILFAVITGLSLVGLFALDILAGVKSHGVKNEVIEIAKAAGIAIAVWIAVILILGSSAPISAIVSCSLLPAYERGDMIVIMGVPAAELSAPEVKLTSAELSAISMPHPSCGKIGPIEYACSNCTRAPVNDKSNTFIAPCISEIRINDQTIKENLSNDVIVYAPTPYIRWGGGDIIHRVFVKLNVDGSYYLLTKGDNNAVFDATMFAIVPAKDVKGKVILRIPFLGYLKLFISGFFEDPTGCESIYLR